MSAAPNALPYLPFTRPTIDDATIAGVADVLRSGWITSGPNVKAFEAKLSEFCGGRPVRAFNSGTCTMEIALRIAGVGPGHEVITTPLSWVATSNIALDVGARPVFVDIDPVTRNLDLARVEAAITPATRAIIPVDLAGLPVDRDRLNAIAKKHNLRVVEDAAQSFGSTWGGKRIGSFGDFVSFSFHANKNITTVEGGCLVLNNETEAKLAEQYRLQGVVRTGFDGMDVDLVGGKYNLTDVAARVGLGQLPRLDEFNAKRRELARAYFELLSHKFQTGHETAEPVGAWSRGAPAPVSAEDAARAPHPQETPDRPVLGLPVANFTDSNWHMFQVMLPEARLTLKRADVMAKMHDAGIGTGVHYPAIHLFSLYRRLGWKPGDYPHAESAGRNLLTLPLFPTMTRADVVRVVDTLAAILQAHQRS